jgi:hypothetical protein
VGPAREAEPPGGAVKRAIVHSLLIVGLIGVGWALQLTENHFPELWSAQPWERQILGNWRWIPAVIGCAVLGLAVPACFAATKKRTRWLTAMLVLPGLLMVTSAYGYAHLTERMMDSFVDAALGTRCFFDANTWFTRNAYFAQTLLTRGMMWSGLGYVAIAIAAGCAPAPRRANADTLLWAWPLAAAAASTLACGVYVAGYGNVFFRLLRRPDQPVWGTVTRNALDFLHVETLQILLPLLTAMVLLGGLPLLLLTIRPRVEELHDPAPPHLPTARAAAAFALLGAGVGLESPGAFLAASAANGPFRSWHGYLAAGATFPVLLLGGLVAAAPLLLASVNPPRRWIVPASLLVSTLLALLALRQAAVNDVSEETEPRCRAHCRQLDRQASKFCLAPVITNPQLRDEWCDIHVNENENLTLVRTAAHGQMEVATTVTLERHRILLDNVPIGALSPDTPLDADCDLDELSDLRFELAVKVEDALVVAARNPNNRFFGRLMVVPDARTPSGTLDCVLRTAIASGFDEPAIVVARPSRRGGWRPKTMKLHAKASWLTPEQTPSWTLHAAPNAYTLRSPAGQQWSSTSPDILRTDAHKALAGQPSHKPLLWIYRTEEMPLAEDIQLREMLTKGRLFGEVWAPSLHPQSTTATIPAQASPTTNP